MIQARKLARSRLRTLFCGLLLLTMAPAYAQLKDPVVVRDMRV
jgi:hypothetical protein